MYHCQYSRADFWFHCLFQTKTKFNICIFGTSNFLILPEAFCYNKKKRRSAAEKDGSRMDLLVQDIIKAYDHYYEEGKSKRYE